MKSICESCVHNKVCKYKDDVDKILERYVRWTDTINNVPDIGVNPFTFEDCPVRCPEYKSEKKEVTYR